MRIHTNAPAADMLTLRYLDGIGATWTEHGSRSHMRAFEVQLSGSGYARNSGTRGASSEKGATWDEWGIWLNKLFLLDPAARVGGTAARPVYADRADFRECTGYRYDDLKIGDQHRKHRWEYQRDGSFSCKCGAARWPVNVPDPHASLAR